MRSDIHFKRARNKENKEIRFTQIKNVAIKLFDELPYHEISLSKLGNEINFTRANLYKYITSKEDIYLYILLDEIKETVSELEQDLMDASGLETGEFALIWTKILMKHPRFLKLFSLLYMIIEQNADLEALVNFKNGLLPASENALKIIRKNFPEFSDQEAGKVLDYAMSLIISRYPICYPAEIQKRAVEKSKFPYEFPDFEKSYSEGLVLIINGIKLSKF